MTAADREAYLSEHCGSDDDADLRAEVDRLVVAHSSAGRFIEQSPVAAIPATPLADAVLTGCVVGRYQVGRRIGVGGMGEVYVARDVELGRDVALKIALDNDPESQARLRREAQRASRLNHPRICTIHEIGSIDAKPFIAMELIEGQTLAQRIAAGPLSLDEALRIGRQIIEALDEAHAHGVIHRDLKPSNVKIRSDGTVKVLDFGLAKMSPSTAITPEANADVTASVTRAGVILGTPAYMAPEQVQGKPIDKRVDIWAFGCVLYEMVTGAQPFRGGTISDVLAAVLTSEPAWESVPPSLHRLLRRCLERDPASRLRDIADATALIDEAPAVSGLVSTHRRRTWWVQAAVVALLVTAIAVFSFTRPPSSATQVRQVRFDIQPPNGRHVSPFSFAPSPDGRSVAFLAEDRASGRRALWIYTISSAVSREVASLDRGVAVGRPFWSPDGRSIGVYDAGKIRRIDVDTGTMETVCDVPGLSGIGSWNKDDVIVFSVTTSDGNEGVMRVHAAGGTPARVTHTDRAHDQLGHGNPQFLPDGRFFVYQAVVRAGLRDLYVGSIDGSPDDQNQAPLLSVAGVVLYAPSPDPRNGYLLFMKEGKLMAQPFDNRQRRLAGSSVVVPGQASNEIASLEFMGAADLLTYRRLARPDGSLVLVDRNGRETPALGGTVIDGPEFPRFSPDGRRLALVVNGDIWVYDLGGRPAIKLTFDGTSFAPVWTPDGRRLIFETPSSLRSIAADGSERESRPASRNGHYHAHSWARGGGELIGLEFVGLVARIVAIPADGTGEPRAIVNTRGGGNDAAAISPDGRWLAYSALTTGQSEIWVQPFPSGAPTRVSARGGFEPVWRRDGQELFYLEGQKMMAVAVKTGEPFSPGEPSALFDGPYLRQQQPPSYDVSADGRFLMIKPVTPVEPPITAILNWTLAMTSGTPAR